MVWWPMEDFRGRFWFALFLGLSLLTLPGWNSGFGATLVWNPNPPEEGIAHYTVYVESSGAPTQTNITSSTSFPLTQLFRGIFYTLRVTATDTNGVESLPSDINFILPLPPEITVQPVSRVLSVGNALGLSVGVTGTPPFSFQWRRNGVALPGQTSQSLQISAVTLLDSGNYSVQISNAAGSVVSSEATVSITDLLLPPEITAQPQSLTVNQGAQIALAVTATGSLPLSFQWYKNGLLLTGRTAPSLLISSASTADAGSYTVRVSNLFGSDESDSAIVSVQAGSSTAPRIITQPQAIAVNEGSSAALSVEAEGQPVLQFAWFKNGQSLPGETSPILSFSSITKAEEGTYTVRVSNSFGTASSDPANVVVFPLPRVTLQPESVAVRLNNTLLLTVVATSSTALGYQWFKDGVEIPGATAATYRVLFMQATDTGSYQVRVSNNAGSILSQEAVVTIAVAPQITQQPVDTTVNEGTELHLSFQASGSGPFLVEWVRNNVVVQVTNKTELTLSAIKPADAGSYAARVSGPGGTVSTAPVTVRVEPKPVITLQPQGAAVQIGASVTLAVSATGNGTLVYQWFKDGQLIPGAENIFLVVSIQSKNDLGAYTVRVSNAAGSTESNPAIIQLLAPPTIISQPAGVDVLAGEFFNLSLEVQGTSPFTFQWFRNGTPLPGASAASFNVSNATTNDAGVYHVVVTNSVGSIQSSNATVRVISVDPGPAAGRLSITMNASGTILFGQGEPGATYDVQLCSDLSTQDWITIQTVVADPNGRFQITAPSSGHYWFIRTFRP